MAAILALCGRGGTQELIVPLYADLDAGEPAAAQKHAGVAKGAKRVSTQFEITRRGTMHS